MEKLIIIGKITGAHGVRGELKVFPLTDDPRRFLKLKECFTCGQDMEKPEAKVCANARMDRGNVLVRFEGIEDRDKAELLRGRFIAVERANAVKLKKDSYFITDLKGLTVIDDTRGDIGKVVDCFQTGPQYTLEIKRSAKKNLLLPFVKVYCYEVSIEEGFIKCRLPEGLYELYD
ncbi:ribosome maturation factor RimM [Butyrivibrio sp. AE2032]|uniref:ribosome maturation factor RimM n=1 Tax=Butyrivibrio sp. AE2032 TaxID=1458463 RepID=UPI000690F086|nr:ribosome maturation factor RimM [Butyrivibrio sp. AE2032]